MVALAVAVGFLATGTACAKNEDKLNLQKTIERTESTSGVFRYTDDTPATPLAKGKSISVRGLIEDDFRYKARLTIDQVEVLDEVVSDDALAVRFLDPSFIGNFTSSGGDAATVAALRSRAWVADPKGAPSVGDAAVQDQLLGVDPIVDSLSVLDYAKDAVAQAAGVRKFNPEGLDYRPAEDPFPRPAEGSGVVRWDVRPKDLPRADAQDTSQGSTFLAHAENFRQMAIYVKDGRVVQVREQIAAKFDLLTKFRNYIERLLDRAGGQGNANLKKQVQSVKDQPEQLEPLLSLILNIALQQAGDDPIRFRSMKFELARQGEKVRADLPAGSNVKVGDLGFFGVNSAAAAKVNRNVADNTTTTTAVSAEPTTTTSP